MDGWYGLVARQLQRERGVTLQITERPSRVNEDGLREKINKLKKQNHDLRQENALLSCEDPLGRTISANVDHASKQRIRDLEAQVRHLGGEPQ